MLAWGLWDWGAASWSAVVTSFVFGPYVVRGVVGDAEPGGLSANTWLGISSAAAGLLIALIRDPGKGTLKGLQAYLPPTLQYWTTLRMIRSSQWDAEAVVDDMATATLRALPPPTDGVLYLIGDSTLKDKRGRKHPLGHTTRHSEHDPYTFGFEMVLLIASWGRVRVPG